MSIFEAIILGLIQGLTEFLPVSSSGHLVIFQDLLGMAEPGVTLEVLLHFGTLLSVIWVFRADFLKLFIFWRDQQQQYFLIMLIIGAAVTAVLGLLFSGYVDLLFKSTLLVGFMLLITGTILKIITFIPVGNKDLTTMKAKDAIWIGLLQGLAIIPGISRSGSTIMASLWRGLDRETAVRYSFILSAPIIFGATLLEIKELFAVDIEREMLINYTIGGLVSFLAGIVAIRVFIRLLSGQKLHYFSYYCWAIGIVVITVSLLRIN